MQMLKTNCHVGSAYEHYTNIEDHHVGGIRCRSMMICAQQLAKPRHANSTGSTGLRTDCKLNSAHERYANADIAALTSAMQMSKTNRNVGSAHECYANSAPEMMRVGKDAAALTSKCYANNESEDGNNAAVLKSAT